VDPRDIAEVAATTLRRPGHDGRTYVLTGPEPISPRQRAHIIGDVLGEPITFAELTREQARGPMQVAPTVDHGSSRRRADPDRTRLVRGTIRVVAVAWRVIGP
jgi:uncharacterized protein YbjT (DUF2867 family)